MKDLIICFQFATLTPPPLRMLIATLPYAKLSQGPKIWNSLPTYVKAATSFHSFKQIMKSFLIGKQNTAIHS